MLSTRRFNFSAIGRRPPWFRRKFGYLDDMETATVIFEGNRQTVRLSRNIRLPATVFVRQDGDAVVLEPAKPKVWPEGFFDSIHISDPAFERPEQSELPPAKNHIESTYPCVSRERMFSSSR